ncbi:GDP-mannose 4,6-dehydratase [bacterium]|nr:GDP-mannose 4,6-dehydratase [bacterium]
MRVLVTGGAGFIGSHLCEALLRRGELVTILDNFDDFYDPAIKWRNIEWCEDQHGCGVVEGDICNPAAMLDLFSRGQFDAVVHLAALAGVRLSLDEPQRFNDVNVGGTINLLEAARRHGCPRFILASTSSAYGLSAAIPYREDDPLLSPVSVYGATKIACEKYGHIYHQVHGLPLVSLRFFTAHGERQRPDMAIHRFTRMILNGEELTMYGDGSTSRDYTYIADVVNGILAALDSGIGYGVFNIGDSERHSLGTVISLIEQACGVEARIRQLPEQPGDPPHTCADISLAREQLGYTPTVSLAEGISRFVEWYKGGQVKT